MWFTLSVQCFKFQWYHFKFHVKQKLIFMVVYPFDLSVEFRNELQILCYSIESSYSFLFCYFTTWTSNCFNWNCKLYLQQHRMVYISKLFEEIFNSGDGSCTMRTLFHWIQVCAMHITELYESDTFKHSASEFLSMNSLYSFHFKKKNH